MNNCAHELNRLHDEALRRSSHLRARSLRISVARIAVFGISAVFGVLGVRDVAFFHTNGEALLMTAGFAFVGFLVLIRVQSRVEIARSRADALASTIARELQASAGDYSAFDGSYPAPENHPWAHDLDLFGENSLYSILSRCASPPAKEALRSRLLTGPVNAHSMPSYHNAVASLADARAERLAFMAAASVTEASAERWDKLAAFAHHAPPASSDTLLVKTALVLTPLYAAGVLTATALDALGNSTGMLLMMVPLAFAGLYFKSTSAVYHSVSGIAAFAAELEHLISKAGDLPAQSERVTHLTTALLAAREASARLARIVRAFDQRNNMFAALVTNATYLSELRNARAVQRWHLAHHQEIHTWISAIAELEVLNSFASFYDLHRDQLSFPVPSETPGVIHGVQMVHPLLLQGHAVANDVDFTEKGRVMLITGANMAGKSTYLRTVGLNVLLARIGAPVAAQKLTIGDVRLYTSMRTGDSIASGTSYFMAELRRLSELVHLAESEGPPVLALLDEILKGTNSADKEAGSRAFTEKLLRSQVRAMIATHDVSLCTLALEHERLILNRYFAADVGSGDLHFDYRLRDGVCDTMNATWLMRKMNIIDA